MQRFVNVIANFSIGVRSGFSEYWMEDAVKITVPADMPYFDVVGVIEDVIEAKYGSEYMLGNFVDVKRFACASCSAAPKPF